jgi:hypothetical protein
MTRWLILLALGLGPVVTLPALSPAEATFAHLKDMAGTWTAHSTRGWNEDLRFQVIAGGSAVLETSFDAHPGETMATLFYMDGPRLMLTHYCVAKNQPRLMATSFEDDNRTVTFTFVDATNLPTRDHGHMDKVVYHFTDDDHTTSQWTWFQDQSEQWMEKIEATRKRGSTR